MIARISREAVAAVAVFLGALTFAFFVDAVRVQKESRDPGILVPVDAGLRPLTRHVVLVVIDSLPERVGNNESIMPKLVALGRSGAHGVMIAPPDTVTTAGVRAMSVGTKPGFNDTLEMFSHKHYSHWTVFDDLVAKGREVAFFGDHAWADLLGNRALDQRAATKQSGFYGNDEQAFANLREHLHERGRKGFTALHISKTDYYAHQFGTEREEYRKVLHALDEQVATLISEVLDGQTTVIVTSDHGNDFFGNHGGSGDIYRRVPLVLAGAGIRHVDGFEMDARQLPLALAVLLGTRLPGGIAKPLPLPFLDITASQTAQLEAADLSRLRGIVKFLGAESSENQSAAELVSSIESSSRANAGLVLWTAVIFLALVLAYLSVSVSVPLFLPALLSGVALFLLICLSSWARLPALGALLLLELGVVIVLMRELRPAGNVRTATAATLGALGAALVSAIRFHWGGKVLFAAAKVALPLIAIVLVVVIWRAGSLRKTRSMVTNSLGWAVPVALVALGLLQPIEVVPVLLCLVAAAAALAAGIDEVKAATVAAGLGAFFLFSQRFGFGWTGERMGARYLYALLAGGLLSLILALWTRQRARASVFAFVSLVPLWAFGYLHVSREIDSGAFQLAWSILAFGASAALAWKTGAARIAWAALLTGLAYHVYPQAPIFWGSLAFHAGAFVVLICGKAGDRRPLAAALMLSLLYLMSPGTELLSVLLLCLVAILALKSKVELAEGALVVLAAALVAYVRYGIFDTFGHSAGAPYSLGNLDTHSGFAVIEGTTDAWLPTALVVGKMICASTLVFLLFFQHPRLRGREGNVFVACLALMLVFVLEASIELALSFGPNDGRVSMSIVQMILQGGIMAVTIVGYAGYRFLIPLLSRRARG